MANPHSMTTPRTMGRVTLAPVDPNLFSDTALEAARACTSLKENKPAQLRKFYDELVMWHDKVHFAQSTEAKEAKFKEVSPFIQMMQRAAGWSTRPSTTCSTTLSARFRRPKRCEPRNSSSKPSSAI